MHTRICDTFGIEFPIFAFSHCRNVVAAVSRSGGLGVLGAAGFSPEDLDAELTWIDEQVGGKPYGVDVLIPVRYVGSDEGGLDLDTLQKIIPEEHRKFVDDLLERYHVPPLLEGDRLLAGFLNYSHKGARSQVDVGLSHPIKLLVSALGPPPEDVIAKAHSQGVKVAALVGRADQAIKQVQEGVDIIVAQGTEAGGHTGEISTMVLVPEVVDAVQPVPVLAAGGIGCGRQIAAAIALGADGVWTGSMWLTASEADMIPPLLDKLLRATSADTVRARCLTGKTVRQLKTAWTDAWESPESPGPLPMPLQSILVIDAVTRIHKYAHMKESQAKELIGYPVGQIVGRMNSVRSCRELMHELVNQFLDAATRVSGLVTTEH